jgi:hypothetical protein
MAEQFKAVGGGEFKIPFMADNIGGFKINGTVAGPRLPRQEEELQLQWQELLQQILNQRLLKVLITIVVFQVLKAICCRQHTVAQQVFLRNG